jgi:two-component system, cell cycle sensor histidine kinase and response regulator CckA
MPPVAPTILVIDDEPIVLDTMARSLERVGFRVLRADSAEQARQLATTSTLELILSDVNMPGLRGPELVTELKAAGILCPVMFTSGDPSFDVVDKSLQVPGATFLPKPFTGAELVDAVFETLGQR